jgi:hypothetical protein
VPVWGSLEDLGEARLRVDYTQPGWYEWQPAGMPAFYGWTPFTVAVQKGDHLRYAMVPHVRARTRDAVLQAARGIDPEIRRALLQHARLTDASAPSAFAEPQSSQVAPTRLGMAFAYIAGRVSDQRGPSIQIGADGKTALRSSLVKSDRGIYSEVMLRP